jgi:hypothetical protein
MTKIKTRWMKIPQTMKIKLWRIMKDNQAPEPWQQAVDRTEFEEQEKKYIRTSRSSYNKLLLELIEMTISEVDRLPIDLREWVISIQKKPREETVDQPVALTEMQMELRKHFKRVSETANLLASCVKVINANRNELQAQYPFILNNFGLLQFQSGLDDDRQVIDIDDNLAQDVLIHSDNWWDIPFNSWENMTVEDADQDLYDNLRDLADILADNNYLEPFSKCSICRKITGIMTTEQEDRIKSVLNIKTEDISEIPDDF